MNVEFWFDPICPFCWMASRWLDSITDERDLRITWRPISLLFKNDLTEGHPFFEPARRTRDLLRVVESVRTAGLDERIGDLYTEFGRRIHHEAVSDFDVAEILTGLGLDPSHAEALDDESFDDAIRDGMADGLALVGNEVGTPIIAVDGAAGQVGLFGPVITKMPSVEEGVKLWDGFMLMVDTDGFFELKRTRTNSPDMSTIDLG